MAYIKNTAFEARVSNNKRDDLVNVTGRYREDGKDAECSAGILCVRDGKLPCAGFGASVFNENAWYMKVAPAAANAGEVIYASNTYEWPTVTDARTNNTYALGRQTLGLSIPEGNDGTFTKVVFNGENVYRFGAGNISGELGDNKFLTIADGLLKPAASAPTATGAIYFTVEGTGNFVEGNTQSFAYVDVIGHVAFQS